MCGLGCLGVNNIVSILNKRLPAHLVGSLCNVNLHHVSNHFSYERRRSEGLEHQHERIGGASGSEAALVISEELLKDGLDVPAIYRPRNMAIYWCDTKESVAC